MARTRKPTSSGFGQLIRSQREKLTLTTADIGRSVGRTVAFIELLESGKRGCSLDDLPRLANALQLATVTLARSYLAERHPSFYEAVFGAHEPADSEAPPPVPDVHWRLDELPRRERGIIEALIYSLYELNVRRVA